MQACKVIPTFFWQQSHPGNKVISAGLVQHPRDMLPTRDGAMIQACKVIVPKGAGGGRLATKAGGLVYLPHEVGEWRTETWQPNWESWRWYLALVTVLILLSCAYHMEVGNC